MTNHAKFSTWSHDPFVHSKLRSIEEGEIYAMTTRSHRDADSQPSLLLVDDDIASCEVLARALAARGFRVRVAHTTKQASRLVDDDPPQYAVIGLKLPDASGLELVSSILALDPHTRIVVLAGCPSIRTAVDAIKLGATDYLAKPANADEVVLALHRGRGNDSVPVGKKLMSVQRAEWEYISHVLRANNGNISASARALSMDRRTLQRKLRKRPPSE
jgi:two-component system, response regulator RegA